ncbi:hypothetical protein K402DRAFT_421067 [Aulographum hederae CBS 113979]|uniref:BZIP domain-containing protein n=1 Tax=Aulographum hederae CBS 113979 TaxID=1176131 RepID=A0A6G1H0M5_9PEZI|nr:hypothetical protein K402DRAFT_421067 [Aulographum hederae CBS 113979]
MSYAGRRGLNFSAYLAELNTVPDEMDVPNTDFEGLDNDLNLFTHTDFLFNQNSVQPMPQATVYDSVPDEQSTRVNNQADSSALDFTSNDFQFANFPDFDPSIADPSVTTGLAPTQQTNNFNVQDLTSPSSSVMSPSTGADSLHHAGDKRKLDSISDPTANMDEAARMAAEEDKRRRNTAASARFRVKKKQKEQQLEKTAKEMTAKVDALQVRIDELEKENTWLKALVTGKQSGEGKESNSMSKIEEAERSLGNRTDGVGTTAEAK